MIITDTLNGRTVEDVRRNQDGSVTLYTDSGRVLTLHVDNGQIEVKPGKMILPDAAPIEAFPSERMRLLQAFQGLMINCVTYLDDGGLSFTCEPKRHDRKAYHKAHGHRVVKMTHTNGLIDELPPVSAVISLEGLSVFGERGL